MMLLTSAFKKVVARSQEVIRGQKFQKRSNFDLFWGFLALDDLM